MNLYSLFSLVVLVALLPISSQSLADYYQCINNQGKMKFKDTPCNAEEKLVRKVTVSNKEARYSKRTYSSTDLNLVKNPSFDNRLSHWTAQHQTNWEQKLGRNTTGAVSIQAKLPPVDKYIHETTVKQCIPLNAGTRYKLVVSVRLNSIPSKKFANRANLYWYESENCTTGGQFGSYLQPENKFGWQTLTADNLTPALHAKAALIILAQRGRYSNGSTVLWDDILLVATEFNPKATVIDNNQYTLARGINYLTNGAFNAKLDGWRVSSDIKWSQFIGHTEPGTAHVGSYSNSGSRGSGAFSQCVNFGENKNFELGASVKKDKSSTARGGGRLRVTWYQDLNCKGPSKTDTNWKDPKSKAGWQKLHIKGLVAPPDSRSAVIEIIQSILEEGHYYTFWDDIYFRATR